MTDLSLGSAHDGSGPCGFTNSAISIDSAIQYRRTTRSTNYAALVICRCGSIHSGFGNAIQKRQREASGRPGKPRRAGRRRFPGLPSPPPLLDSGWRKDGRAGARAQTLEPAAVGRTERSARPLERQHGSMHPSVILRSDFHERSGHIHGYVKRSARAGDGGFAGDSGTGESLNTAPLSAETSQQRW